MVRARSVTAARALERGTQFLLARQGADGLWRDFFTPAREASEWPTDFIATALHLASAPADALERAGNALLATQNTDGGWGYNEEVPTDADSTAWVLLFLTRLGRSGDPCRRAAFCLVDHQRTENGGIATYSEPGSIRRFMGLGRWVPFGGWCSPHTEVTAAGRALAAAVPDGYPAAVRAASEFVWSRQNAGGSWDSYWWTSPHYTTLQAVEFARLRSDRASVRRAAEWALRTQDGEGGWNAPDRADSAFATALGLSILVIADAAAAPVERAIDRLTALQDADGSWPSHPIMRIPLPGDRDPNGQHRWRPVRFASGIVVEDQHRTFTCRVRGGIGTRRGMGGAESVWRSLTVSSGRSTTLSGIISRPSWAVGAAADRRPSGGRARAHHTAG